MEMLRFLRSKIPAGHHDARVREREEFFKFAKTVHHGFPSKPSCLAYDPELNLLAIGTKNGFVKIYGAPGVEFVGQHESGKSVLRLFFLPNQGRIVSLCEDQTFHLWEVNFREGRSFLDHVKECATEDRLKKISGCTLKKCITDITDENQCYSLLIGTESGNVYSLDTKSLELTDFIIYQDAVIQNIPDDYKVNPGAVESIAVCPTDPNLLLLGYTRGLVVMWDGVNNTALTYVSQQGVECVCWHKSGTKFVSAHNDGSYVVWSAADNAKPMLSPNCPFGPFPCKPIDRILWKTGRNNGGDVMVFTGGMPRASYGDRHAVAVDVCGLDGAQKKQTVFELTSRVIDVVTLDCLGGEDDPHTLLILCEEELVAIDLMSEAWPEFRLPYLLPFHASPVTAAQHVPNVNEDVWQRLKEEGAKQGGKVEYSKREWPIQGGRCGASPEETEQRDLLVTGHEDGTVKLWGASSVNMPLLYTLNTATIADGYTDPKDNPDTEEEDWPFFRKVGAYDPYSDDPRFGVQRLCMDGASGLLVVGGTAGLTVVWELTSEPREVTPSATEVAIVTDGENFVWKGHEKLELSVGKAVKFLPGFAPKSMIQTNPPASVTALSVQAAWGVVGIGTAHGYALFDFVQNRAVMTKCLLNPNDLAAQAAASEGRMARLKSFKKSLRDSFRRRRRHAGAESPRKEKSKSPEPPKTEEDKAVVETTEGEAAASTTTSTATAVVTKEITKETSPKPRSPKKESPKRPTANEAEEEEMKPVERAVEARGESPASVAEQLTSLVRCIHFAHTFILNTTTLSHTFWVGTNAGAVYIHTITFPGEKEKRNTELVECTLAKEIQLQHRAPVLFIAVVDGRDFSLDDHPPIGGDTTPVPGDGGHRLILCSEEQVKSFQLPTLKPGRQKYKLTATEGTRIRKVQMAKLRSKTDDKKWESFVVVMTNQGEMQAYATHTLRRFLRADCIKSSDIAGILSTVLTRNGEGMYLRSSSEWQRFTIASPFGVTPDCSLDLPEGLRPAPVVVAEPEPEVEKDKKDENGLANHKEETETEKMANSSVLSSDSHNQSMNQSTLPSDLTVDSIRDYTTTQHQTLSSEKTNGEGAVIVTKITKTTIVTSSETVDTPHLMNGDSDDEIAKLKAMNLEAAAGKDPQIA